jgi:DNA modification methylase
MTLTVLRADARHLPIPDDSVDLVVTSPPYFGLRSYQDGGQHYDGQVGAEATPAEFLDALIEVTRECVRVLKPTGSLWVNLGDKYAGSNDQSGGTGDKSLVHGSGRQGGQPTTMRRGFVAGGAPTKSLIGIPWRYALRCIDDLGLILRAEVIWAKPNGLPESVTDRVRRSHETWFHFTLQPRYFSAVDEIREQYAPGMTERAARYAGRDLDPNTWAADSGRGDSNPSRGNLGFAHRGLQSLGKLPGSVWTVPTEPLRVPEHLGVDHFAAFPSSFPRRIIAGWSPSGVCVECGEGRRPVGDKDRQPTQAVHNGHGFMSPDHGGRDSLPHRTLYTPTGYACACGHFYSEVGTEVPTTPAVVLDPFGGTGTTAHVAHALGRHGISVDLSADYCRLASAPELIDARVRKVLGIDKAPAVMDGQGDLFDIEPTNKSRPSVGLGYAKARGPRECPGCGYRVQYASRSTCEACGADLFGGDAA